MKGFVLLIGILGVIFFSCQDITEGYLLTENASYDPDTSYIRLNLDPTTSDSVRIKYQSPWVTFTLQGYEGTSPIHFSIESVRSDKGEESARLFKEELDIRGGGAILCPFKPKAGPGTYVVSVRLSNHGYSHVLKDAYTFIVE